MDQYKRERLKHRRGDWCLVHYGSHNCYLPTYGQGGSLCGCGTRTPPPRKHQDRIIRRALQRELEKEITSAQEAQEDANRPLP